MIFLMKYLKKTAIERNRESRSAMWRGTTVHRVCIVFLVGIWDKMHSQSHMYFQWWHIFSQLYLQSEKLSFEHSTLFALVELITLWSNICLFICTLRPEHKSKTIFLLFIYCFLFFLIIEEASIIFGRLIIKFIYFFFCF